MWVDSMILEYVISIMWGPAYKVRMCVYYHAFRLSFEKLGGDFILLALFIGFIFHPDIIHYNYYM